MSDLSDADLDRRLRAAGLLLDDLAAARSAVPRRRSGRRAGVDLGRGPRLVLAAAVVAFVALAVGAALVVSSSSDDPGPTVASTTTRPEPFGPADPDAVPEVSLDELAALGAGGEVAASDTGLVDLATGEVTPLVSPGTWSAPATVATPDGEGGWYYLSYDEPNASEGPKHLDLRRRTAQGDVLVEASVSSMARRADGTLALAVGVDPARTTSSPFLTDIVVVAPDGSRTTWSQAPAEQDVVAWAGDRLFVAGPVVDSEATSLQVYDGPGTSRELSPQGSLLALDPDARWAFVSGVRPGEEPIHDDPLDVIPTPRVVDLATGAEIGEVDLGPDVAGPGHLTWTDDGRLVGATALRATTGPAVVELAVDEGADGSVTIRHLRTVALDPARTFVPHQAWSTADGTLVALASPQGAFGKLLYVCPVDEECTLVDPPFGDTGQVAYVSPAGPG